MTHNVEVISLNAADAPPLIGVDGVAELYAVPPNTAYSWAARGQLGIPDLKVSNRALWYADRFPDDPDPKRLDLIDKGPRPDYPAVLFGPGEVAAAFGIRKRTVDAWRRRARDLPADDPHRPPEPLLTVSLTPIWRALDWKPFANAKRKQFDVPPLSAWRRHQRAAVRKKQA